MQIKTENTNLHTSRKRSSKQYIIMVGIQWLQPSSTDYNVLCGVERVRLKHRLTWVLTMDPTLREGLSGLPYGILALIIITEIYNVWHKQR